MLLGARLRAQPNHTKGNGCADGDGEKMLQRERQNSKKEESQH